MTNYSTFDASDYLDSPEVMAEYLTAATEDPNPDVLLAAIANVAKALGMARVAKDAGIGRVSLYKALRPGARPGYATIAAVLRAMDVHVAIIPNEHRETAA